MSTSSKQKPAVLFIDYPRGYYLTQVKKHDFDSIVLLPPDGSNIGPICKDQALAGEVIKTDLWNFTEVLDLVQNQVRNRYNILRVVSHNEYFIELSAYLEERLVPDPMLTSRTAVWCRDKYLMRKALSECQISEPRFTATSRYEEALAFLREINQPVVIKPRFGTASIGVIKINDEKDLQEHFKVTKRISVGYKLHSEDPNRVMIEEYIPGKEYGIETLMYDGKMTLFLVSEKPKPFIPPFFEESIYLHQSGLEESMLAKIRELIGKMNLAMGISHGASHVEIRINGDQIYIIEIAARNGSSFKYLSAILDDAYENIQLTNFLKLENVNYLNKTFYQFVGYFLIQSPGSGKLLSIKGVETARQIAGIYDIDLYKKENDRIVPFPFFNGYIGNIYAKGTRAGVLDALEKAHQSLEIKMASK